MRSHLGKEAAIELQRFGIQVITVDSYATDILLKLEHQRFTVVPQHARQR